MKSKVFACLSVFIMLSTQVLFAHGKKDVEDIPVENLQSWQERIDLESRTKRNAQKYNIMVTATDLGGNTAVEGPFNLYVDPESDRPVCGITNPYYDMRVVGNLNIIGTCVDDDAVAKVELILDEGKVNSKGESIEKKVTAKGTDFWSYYLDTNSLEEGPHTIKVIGYDINGLESNPKNTVVMQWQLDRKQPVTNVNNIIMGELVSGTVHFKGTVTDGNGIKELYYSTDNGQFFAPVKISGQKDKENKYALKDSTCVFDFTVDSKKFPDGAAVILFKAVDVAGSVGYYSFLYFIDNTKPEISIVYPAKGQAVNGKFTAAGYARDTIGVTDLSWSFGNKSGKFELTPGNPYWSIDLDTTGSSAKSEKLTIRAVDKAGNVVEHTETISLNPEADKPVATISNPAPGTIFTGNSNLVYVRGFVKDDDGVSKVKVQLDNQPAVEQETNGAYYYNFCKASDLSAGSHRITVIPYDENGVQGNPVAVNFESRGVPPTFSDAKLGGKAFENGMEVHPETGSVFEITVNAQLGLKQVHSELLWGKDGMKAENAELKNAGSYKVSIPLNPDSPRGVMSVEIKATDSLDRVSEYRAFFHVTDTGKILSDELKLVLDDSSFEEQEDGSLVVVNNSEFPASGYVIGGNPVSVEVVPATSFVRPKIVGNQIVLQPGSAVGTSAPVKLHVRTDRNGKTLVSQAIVFKNDKVLPVFSDVRANGSRATKAAVDGSNGSVKITGRVSCETGLGNVSYRLLKAYASLNPKNAAVTSVKNEMEEYQDVKLSGGSFTIEVNTEELNFGSYLVEIVAESAAGNKKATAVLINNLPETSEVVKPVVTWFDSFDVYGVAVTQEGLDQAFEAFARKDMNYGNNVVEMTVDVAGVPTVYKSPSVNRPYELKANIATVDDEAYKSGMQIIMPRGAAKTAEHFVKIAIDTLSSVSGVSYEISGAPVPGGDVKQSGSAKVEKADEGRYYATIPLNNLPARITNIKAVVKAAGCKDVVVNGTVAVVRPNADELDDAEKIYNFADYNTVYDSQDGNYIISNGSKFYYYVNIPTTFTASIAGGVSGLSVETVGNVIVLSATKDGNYRDVRVRATDPYGRVFESRSINILADSEGPNLVVQTPTAVSWVKKVLSVSGTAQDALGVRSVEYSLDSGATWRKFSITPGRGVTFSRDIDISNLEDGLVTLDIRAIDNADHIAYSNFACFKDTVAPVVTVVEPLTGDIINGENLVVFDVQDEGKLARVDYTTGGRRNSIEIKPLIQTHVGTPDQPIDSRMSFSFVDAAGNSTTKNAWDFKVDSKSDLPRSEIHIPEELEVVTRDFVISGVVFDDDGDSKVYYKIDNGEYRQAAKNEVYGTTNPDADYSLSSNFEITVPLAEMTDNEHSVTVYAVDVNGVRGEETRRKFRVSLEEPKGSVEAPTIDTSVKEVVEISGVASDKNGIAKVEISLDNGNTYNDATGRERWSYKVDTRAIPGGTQVVFLRVTDNYGITGLYSSLINIDNDAPKISLEYPLDDSTSTGTLFFSGHAYDNVEISNMYVTIRNMERGTSPLVKKLKIERIIGEAIDISELPNGFYNVELTGEDKAGNVTNVSRNIHLDKTKPTASVDILYPLNGEHKNGYFNIYGQAETLADVKVEKLRLFVDNKLVKETELTSSGFFKFEINPPTTEKTDKVDADGNTVARVKTDMTDGVHAYKVEAILSTGKKVTSREQTITYNKSGTWITLDNFTYGDFATERPYLKGKVGYIPSEEEEAKYKAKETSKEEKAALLAKRTVAKVEISFDNGKTFELLSKDNKFAYRVENQDLEEGYHFMLIRATMKDGTKAIERTIVQIDNTKPNIRLIAPGKGGRYNQVLDVSGLSSDDVELKDVTITLRKGDKSAYEVPAFIQGLYIDGHFWGATLFEVGLGLTFFDDNVKLQVQWGQFTQGQRDAVNKFLGLDQTAMRYGGNNIWGMKLLANVSSIPFSYFWGHDYDWLYANVALGAQFSRFNQTGSGKPQWLSALLAQVEFPKIVRAKATAFSAFSFYMEPSLWFIPSDVSGDGISSMVFQMGLGLRANIF